MLHEACGLDWAAVTFVDRDRQWFKARSGFDLSETPRDVSFCSVAMQSSQPLIVRDATRDTSFRSNRLVTGKPYLRSYFGMPIFSAEGFGLGSVCVIAMEKPRSLRTSQMYLLASARDWVQASLAARRLALEESTQLPAGRNLVQRRSYAAWRIDQAWQAVQQAHQLCMTTAPAP